MRQSGEVEKIEREKKFLFWELKIRWHLYKEYVSLISEPLELRKIKPKKEWPSKGLIKFENCSFSYVENMNNVLSNLTFELMDGDKIDIVWRTGAVKS